MNDKKIRRIIEESIKSVLNEDLGDVVRIERDLKYHMINNAYVDRHKTAGYRLCVVYVDDVNRRDADRYIPRIRKIVSKYGYIQYDQKVNRPERNGQFSYELYFEKNTSTMSMVNGGYEKYKPGFMKL